MQITRLHILILLIGLVCIGFGVRVWLQQKHNSPETAVASSPKYSAPIASSPKSSTTTPVASLPTSSSSSPDTYAVAKGDTLWRIARDHSPVRQGPGWVAIWKVNKQTIKNFDRIEVGWNIQIPATPEEYKTRFWKPRMLRNGSHIAWHSDDEVDLAQLPVPPLVAPSSPNWPPALPHELEVALLQTEPMPRTLELALLQSQPLPASVSEAFAVAQVPEAPRTEDVVEIPVEIHATFTTALASFEQPMAGLPAFNEFH